MYEAVKVLIETDAPHIHLSQQKLFTLFSIAFQYMLFCSTKTPGVYLVRVEDSSLAEKLARKAKDPSTKKFIQNLLTTRKLKYKNSTFLLDFFNLNSWSITAQIPQDKFRAALIVKNTSSRPMAELASDENTTLEVEAEFPSPFPEDYYRTSITDNVPKTITIAYGEIFDNTKQIEFPFIKQDENILSGVRISSSIDINSLK